MGSSVPSTHMSMAQSSTGSLDGGDEVLCLFVSFIWLSQIDQTNQMDQIDWARLAACIRRP
jgi:hypothetical protein